MAKSDNPTEDKKVFGGQSRRERRRRRDLSDQPRHEISVYELPDAAESTGWYCLTSPNPAYGGKMYQLVTFTDGFADIRGPAPKGPKEKKRVLITFKNTDDGPRPLGERTVKTFTDEMHGVPDVIRALVTEFGCKAWFTEDANEVEEARREAERLARLERNKQADPNATLLTEAPPIG